MSEVVTQKIVIRDDTGAITALTIVTNARSRYHFQTRNGALWAHSRNQVGHTLNIKDAPYPIEKTKR